MKDYIDTAFYLEEKLIYKKLKNKYRIFCTKCQRYEYVTKDQLKQIQKSHICPMCFREIIPTTILEHDFRYFIMNEAYTGYMVCVQFKFGCKPKTYIEEVCHYLGGNKVEVRHIFANMGWGLCYSPYIDSWKKRYAQNYISRFCSLEYWLDKKKNISKKEYIYTALFDRGITDKEADRLVKSNQKKIFMDNLLNGLQMEYVVAFDLKSYADVVKYNTYMKKNTHPDMRRPLNIYYLDYLKRNNIKLSDFYNYMTQCEQLGFKLDKPTDFQHRHRVLSELMEHKKNEILEENIKKRYAQLLSKAYKEGSIRIQPFKDGDEMRRCGKVLHNCVGSVYISIYARGDSDLYYMSKRGKMIAALEVEDGTLIQARADNNEDCPPSLMKHIRKWCRNNQYQIALE